MLVLALGGCILRPLGPGHRGRTGPGYSLASSPSRPPLSRRHCFSRLTLGVPPTPSALCLGGRGPSEGTLLGPVLAPGALGKYSVFLGSQIPHPNLCLIFTGSPPLHVRTPSSRKDTSPTGLRLPDCPPLICLSTRRPHLREPRGQNSGFLSAHRNPGGALVSSLQHGPELSVLWAPTMPVGTPTWSPHIWRLSASPASIRGVVLGPCDGAHFLCGQEVSNELCSACPQPRIHTPCALHLEYCTPLSG